MKTIVTHPKEIIAGFVLTRLREMGYAVSDFEKYSALGLVEDGMVIAGVIYDNYTNTNICMHVAALPGRKWLNREFLYAAFDYPFRQLGVRRVTGLVPKKNRDARRFDEHLGFKLEGVMRQALADDDICVYGMLRGECRWLRADSENLYARAA